MARLAFFFVVLVPAAFFRIAVFFLERTGALFLPVVRDFFFAAPGLVTTDFLRAVRSGPWKLFRNGQLYHLIDDIGEKHNVAANNPEVVKRLTGYLDEFEADIRKNARPVGIAKNPRTLLPRPGVEGEQAFAPTLSLKRK